MSKGFIAIAIILYLSTAATSAQPIKNEEAQKAGMGLMKNLKKNLMAKMQEGGPIAAFDFCKLQAESLTEEYNSTLKKGWEAKRVSDKNRNPDNAADPLDIKALKFFKENPKQNTLWLEEKSKETLLASRFYMPIKIEAPCLQCHGTNINKSLQEKITTHYPKDKATGYRPGQLRGALRLRIPN